MSRGKLARHTFSTGSDGDLRVGDRTIFSAAHRLSSEWATADQVHGSDVVVARSSGSFGEADGLVTTSPNIPLAIFTADCLGIVFEADGAVGVAHAGWRGMDAGVLEATRSAMVALDCPPLRVVIGPAIRSCCFEVGPEVAERFPDSSTRTSWGTVSVDLIAETRRRLTGLQIEVVGGCTRCGSGYFSYRNGDRTSRMASVGWLA